MALFMVLAIWTSCLPAQDLATIKVNKDVLILHPPKPKNLDSIRSVGGTVVAIRTDKGIVLIDTFNSPEIAREGKRLIYETFPEQTVRYVINTHIHADHVGGNSVFGEAVVVAFHTLDKLIHQDHLEPVMHSSGSHTKGGPQKHCLLKVGEKEFEILYFGPTHTETDLVILDRQDRVLMMGDLVCPEKCYLMGSQSNADTWIDFIEYLLERQQDYDVVIPGHCGVAETPAALKLQRKYLSDILSAVKSGREAGLTLEQIQEKNSFKQFEKYMMYDRVHRDVESVWNQIETSQINLRASQETYLGFIFPGETPEVFAPGIVNTGAKLHSCPAISPDGKEMFWSQFYEIDGVRQERIWFSLFIQGRWTPPRQAPFISEYREGGPRFSPDGTRIYFTSCRPTHSQESNGDANIWFVEKVESGWGKPQCLPAPVNTGGQEWCPTIAKNNNLYFMYRKDASTFWDLYCAKWAIDHYDHPIRLGQSINSESVEGFSFIGPDEKYFVFYSERPGGLTDGGELFISHRQKDGTWSPAKNMGEVVNSAPSRFPGITPNGRFFFFAKLQDDKEVLYWVDAKAIPSLNGGASN